MVDKDGRSDYSPVRKLDFGTATDYIIYPNPAVHTLYIAGGTISASLQVQVIDMMSRVLIDKTYRNAGASLSLNIAGLPPGVYGMRLTTAAGKTMVSRFVKR